MSPRFPKRHRTSRAFFPETRISTEFFDSLVENAVDFLKRSVIEIKKSPKYSVIHFCAALELFLKARLMVEHWSIVVSRQDAATLPTFKNGDFQSVSMDEAIRRLENICNESINKEAKDCFNGVRKHRNKLVHFFHSEYIKASRDTIEKIVAEECKAWFYLYRLLTEQWQTYFVKHKKDIEKLNKRMHGLRAFLSAKYQALKLQIDAEVASGKSYDTCASCGYLSARISVLEEPLVETVCLVCSAQSRFASIDCPDCETNINVGELGEGKCGKCNFQVDIDYLLDNFGPSEDPKEPGVIAYCSECEWTERPTAIPTIDGYVCLACFTEHDKADECGYCGVLCTGIDPVSASVFGCIICEGSVAQDNT